MHLDVLDLRDFYYRSTLGRAAQKVIRDELTQLWPEAKGQSVAGFGFSVPLLRPYLKDARRVLAVMPGPQGVMPWPPSRPNVSLLSEETQWPIATGRLDKLVVMHGLETSENAPALLDECWRVLGPGGRAIFVVPNRAGIWSRNDRTPFGYGRPYSLGQLEAQLRHHDFVVEHTLSTLYQPPFNGSMWRKSARLVERIGHNIPVIAAGGVLMVEVTKHMQAPTRAGLVDRVRKPLRALDGIGARPEPAHRGRR